MKVLSKPLRGRSKFVVSMAWHTSRQIYTAPLHRAELTPTLQGFFYAGGNIGDKVEDLPLTKKYYTAVVRGFFLCVVGHKHA